MANHDELQFMTADAAIKFCKKYYPECLTRGAQRIISAKLPTCIVDYMWKRLDIFEDMGLDSVYFIYD